MAIFWLIGLILAIVAHLGILCYVESRATQTPIFTRDFWL